MEKGYMHVYTGDGKGKTTASLGLVLRALGANLSVGVVQFIKSMEYHEIIMLKKLSVPVYQFGYGCFIKKDPTAEDINIAQAGLAFVHELFTQDNFDLLILDEMNIAIELGLLQETEIRTMLEAKPERLELVCTGRNAPQWLIDHADLVTEMTNIKHYYDKGILARDGIER